MATISSLRPIPLSTYAKNLLISNSTIHKMFQKAANNSEGLMNDVTAQDIFNPEKFPNGPEAGMIPDASHLQTFSYDQYRLALESPYNTTFKQAISLQTNLLQSQKVLDEAYAKQTQLETEWEKALAERGEFRSGFKMTDNFQQLDEEVAANRRAIDKLQKRHDEAKKKLEDKLETYDTEWSNLLTQQANGFTQTLLAAFKNLFGQAFNANTGQLVTLLTTSKSFATQIEKYGVSVAPDVKSDTIAQKMSVLDEIKLRGWVKDQLAANGKDSSKASVDGVIKKSGVINLLKTMQNARRNMIEEQRKEVEQQKSELKAMSKETNQTMNQTENTLGKISNLPTKQPTPPSNQEETETPGQQTSNSKGFTPNGSFGV